MVAVPLPLSLNVMEPGSVPVSVSAGVGEPIVVTVVLNADPTIDVAEFALVIDGATLWVSVNVAPPAKLSQPDNVAP
jgi:hypothetical protein